MNKLQLNLSCVNRLVNRWVLVLSAALALSALVVAPLASASDSVGKHDIKTLHVQGKDSVSVEPDQLQFVVGIDARAPTADRAYQQVENKMREVVALLKRLNIPEQDVQAMNLSLQPVIDYKKQQEIIGHKASRDIAIKLKDIDRYGKVMQALGEIEITRFAQLQLMSSQQQALAIEALEQAYLNAETKAKRLAKVSGRKLQGLINLKEHGGSRQPVMMAARMQMDMSESATTSKGTIAIEASVSATFAIE